MVLHLINTPAQQHCWVDRLNPCIIHLSGNFGIRWYGLVDILRTLLAGLIREGTQSFCIQPCTS